MALLVFTSGCAALIFQVAWMRELRLVFGSTTASASAVLAIFMGGLGVGSAVLGPRVDRTTNPLRLYGLLECGIALSAAVSPWLVSLAGATYLGLGGQQALGLAGATALRLALTTAVLFVPAFLMGGTLPAAIRSVALNGDLHRRSLGVLYGANTLGAVVGSAFGTFYALEQLGTRATLWLGCALGLLAGSAAVRVARGARAVPLDEAPDVGDRASEADSLDPSPGPWLAYLVATTLGFSFFALELVWFRMLAPILGGTTFTFGLILCVALLGIGVGGIIYHALFAWLRPTWTALACTCGLEAALTLLPYALGDRLAVLAAWLIQGATGFGDLIWGWCVVASIVVLPPALVSGLQFPLLIALLGSGRKSLSRHVGVAYAWNTLGAIAGSLVAGFGMLPALGGNGMWLALGGLMAALAGAIALAAPEPHRRGRLAVVGLIVATLAAGLATGPTAAWRHSGIGAGRTPLAGFDPNNIAQWRNTFRSGLLWEADGVEASIGIKRIQGHDFVVNGKTDGNSLNDAPTQVGVAILGAMLHPVPKNALVIGLGTGESAGWLAEMRAIEHVDVVELEPAIDEMARLCADLNFNVLQHPKVRRVYNDGREFVLTAPDRYDVIISEPSNPYRAGVATLYTSEFYAAARDRLTPGGVFVQFMQAYEVDRATVETVVRTVRSSFAHVEVWQTMAADLQLVCSDQPIRHDPTELRRRMGDPTIQRALREVWRTPGLEGFLSHFVASAGWCDSIAQTTLQPLNTDDQTVLEYRYAKTVGQPTEFSIEQLRSDIAPSGFHETEAPVDGASEDDAIDWRQVELRRQTANAVFDGQFSVALLPLPEDIALVQCLIHFNSDNFAAALAAWPPQHQQPGHALLRLIYARCLAEQARSECLPLIEDLGDLYPAEAAAIRTIYFTRANQPQEAERWFGAFVERLRANPWVLPKVADTAFSRAIDLARSDRAVAERLYPLFVDPYAGRTLDYIRKSARWMVAKELSQERVVEAMEPLEPYVPWTLELLEARAQAYRATKHTRAVVAERQLLEFRSNASRGR